MVVATQEKDIVSINNRVWKVNAGSDREILYIVQKYKLSEITARVMSARDIDDKDAFLNPLLKTSLPNPFHLLDMVEAVDRVIRAVHSNEKIVILGDYDVDGATSSALLKKYFYELGIYISIYIPDRVREGYGPSSNALRALKKNGFTLCITVDCGTVACEALRTAHEINLDMIVIDHHLGGEVLPLACAVVNPNRLDEDSECREIAAVGVTFLFLIALNKQLRDTGFFSLNQEPRLYDYLDLVALGTVCDVMPLRGLNRVFVAQGLKIMARRNNLGIRVLSDLLEIYEPLTSYHLGFLLGPHINAGGRIGESDLGATLLSTIDEGEAIDISRRLMKYNIERRKLEKAATEEAMKQAELDSSSIITIVSDIWHPGIIGLVASRVKDAFYRPTIVITTRDGVGKASCRSIPGVDIGSLILAAKLQNIIIEGGGHKMAAGFSIEAEKISLLKIFIAEQVVDVKLNNIVKVDAILSLDLIKLKLWYDLQKLAPFGMGHPEPKFILQNVSIKDAKVLKDSHIRCIIHDQMSRKSIKGIAFNVIGTQVGDALLSGDVRDLLGKVKTNHWHGSVFLNFLIEDVV